MTGFGAVSLTGQVALGEGATVNGSVARLTAVSALAPPGPVVPLPADRHASLGLRVPNATCRKFMAFNHSDAVNADPLRRFIFGGMWKSGY